MKKPVYIIIFLTMHVVAFAADDQEYNLLFVGNSLTYSNDLPKLVRQNAASKGITVRTKMVAKPNYAIVDHWAEGNVQNLIKSRKYDYVIIQQGPSSQSDGYHMLIHGGKQYSDLCKEYDVKLAYYMVWPSRMYYHTFDGVIANYTAGAEANDALLCPVGEVWKAHFDATGDFSYYGPDNFHPSLKGSQVAADVIVDSLFNQESAEQGHKQVWLTGVGQITNNQIKVSDLYVTENGAFGVAFNPDEIITQPWGELVIDFDSCHTATMSYSSNITLGGGSFGAGGYALERIAMNESSLDCDQMGFENSLNKAFFSGTFYGGPTRDGEGFMIDYLDEKSAIVTWYTYMPRRESL